MKYKLRFFLQKNNAKCYDDIGLCFATINSGHVPERGQLVFIGDDSLTYRSNIDPGTIYKVVYSVFCFDSIAEYNEGCTAVEIIVKKFK